MSVIFKGISPCQFFVKFGYVVFVNDNKLWRQLLVCYNCGKDMEKLLAVLEVLGGSENGDADKKIGG